MRGRVFKNCGCPVEHDARGRRKACRKPHGSWVFVVDVGGQGGKRKQLKKSGFRTADEAEAALARVVADLDAGKYRDDGRRTVGTFLTEWLDNKVRDGLRPTTERSYRQHVEQYLVPSLGHLRLRDVRPAHISRFLRELGEPKPERKRRVGPSTVRRVHATLRSALGDARREGLIETNPAADASLPKAERPKVRPWEAAELGAFLDHASTDRLGPMFELIALAGLRRGEACGLRWEDVDLDARVLVVRQQVVQVYGRTFACAACKAEHRNLAFGAPKTASGDARRVDLDEHTVGTLLAHRLAQDLERAQWGEAYVDHGLVFAREDGNPIAPEAVTKAFGDLVRAAGLRPVRVHDLRHGHASVMLAAGVPLAVVSKRLGHSSVSITADTYSHLLEGVGRDAAEAAAALIPRRRDQSVTNDAPATPEPTAEAGVGAGQEGGPRGDRTHNPRIKSPLLCQLS